MLNLRLLERFVSLNAIKLGTKIVFRDTDGKEHEVNDIKFNGDKIIISEEGGNLADKE